MAPREDSPAGADVGSSDPDLADLSPVGTSGWAWATSGALWVVAGALMLADVVLSIYGLEIGLREMNPVGRIALDLAGASGLLALKALSLSAAGICWHFVPEDFQIVVPLALLVPTLAAVLVNLVTIGLVVAN